MTTKRLLLTAVLLSLTAGIVSLSSCGGGGGGGATETLPPSITVTVSPNAATVQAGSALQISATVANDSASKGVTWSVSCATAPCGTVSPTSTASGVATTYTAPASPPASNLTVTVTATSVADPTKSASATITVTVAPPISVSASPTTASVAVNATQQFTATVTNTSNTAVTWTLTQGGTACSPGCGTLSSITANPVTYTAPGTVPANPMVTITATSVADITKSGSATITVTSGAAACGTGSESLLNGQYAFVLQGFDASGPEGIGATFSADGAGRVALLVGIEDINSVSGVQTNLSITSASSSYSVGSDHRGCLTIATSAGTQTFRFSLGAISSGVASNGHIIQFDSTGSHTAGVLRKQGSSAFSTAAITGNYAFGASGPHVGGGKFAVVGMLSLSGGVVQAGSVLDFNDSGNVDNGGTTYPVSPISISSGSYAISANGRGTLSLLPAGGTTVNTILYVVSSSEVLILSSDPQSTNDNHLFAGSALQQSGGPFSNSSLNATSVLYTSGLATSGGTPVSKVMAGLVTIPSSGTFSFSGQQNAGGTISPQSASGTYSVASNGRVTFPGGGGESPIVYLVSANRGFVLFTGSSVESGFVEPQTGAPFSTASASGTYAFGTIQPEDSSVSDQAGFAKFDGAGNVSGTSDENSAGTLKPGNSFTQTYSIDATGLGVLPANCTIGTTCGTIFFVISPTKAVVFNASTQPNLQVAEQ